MSGIDMHHRRISPARRPLLRDGRGDRRIGRQNPDLEGPGAGGHHTFVLEIIHLDECVMPVAAHDGPLHAQQVERGLVLIFVQLVGRGDAKLGLVEHQVLRRIRDMDRAVIGLYATCIGLAIGQVHGFEYDVPRGWRLFENIGVIHQNVGAPHIRHAVMHAVHGMPARLLQTRIDGGPRGDQRGIDRLHAAAGDQAQRGVARSGDKVKPALVHQRNHLVRGIGGLDLDHAAGVGLEFGYPVKGLVGLAAFDVAGPGDDGNFAFAVAHCGHLSHDGGYTQHKGQRRGTKQLYSLHVVLPGAGLHAWAAPC